jgi:hypothetical protein
MFSEYTGFLEDGEHVDYVVKALSGINRWLGLGIAAIIGFGVTVALVNLGFGPVVGVIVLAVVFTRLYARRLIVVTDRAVLLMAGRRWRYKPTAVIERLPVDTPLKPLKGLWLELHLGTHLIYVNPRSIRTVSQVETERRDGKRP